MNKENIAYYEIDFYFKKEPNVILQGIVNINKDMHEIHAQTPYVWTIDSAEHMAFLMDRENTFSFVVTYGRPIYKGGHPNKLNGHDHG